jgi:dihydroxyacetone kinase-like protein
MSARGKASLGDKTVLDAVSAAASVSAGLDDPAEIRSRVLPAVDAALDEFRGKPSKIGRARIFADRSIGLDDPGMVAFKVMLGAL